MFSCPPCATLPRMSSDEKTASVQGSVTRISSEPKTAAKGGYLFRGLELAGETDTERLFLIIPEFAGDDLYCFPLLCWEGCRVAAYGLQLNNRLDDGSVIYTATPQSDFILEPHRPVSVTEAVEAAGCIRSVDVRYRVGPDEPFWMAKGKLVHTLFDRMLLDAESPSDEAFHEAFRKALPALKAVLPGSRIPTDLKSLEKDARVHFDHLRAWLDNTRNLFSSAEVELDRISSRWGLKGRTDAILHHKHRRTIVELKSGKVPVLEHLLQLYAYALILREDGTDSAINGCVLYSATGRTETLDSPRSDWQKLVVQGRNRVVALRVLVHVRESRTSRTRLRPQGQVLFPCRVHATLRQWCHRKRSAAQRSGTGLLHHVVQAALAGRMGSRD